MSKQTRFSGFMEVLSLLWDMTGKEGKYIWNVAEWQSESSEDHWNLWSSTKYEVISEAAAMWIGTNGLRVLNTIARCFWSKVLRNTLSYYRSSYSWVIKGSMARTCRNSQERSSFPRCISRLSKGTCNAVASWKWEGVGWLLTADIIDWQKTIVC